MKRSLLLWASAAGLCSASPAFAGPSLPPVPSPDGPPQAAVSPGAPGSNPQPASGALSPQQLYEHVRRGIVAVERNGVPLAVGTVLDGDGRILTSLSALSGSGNADVRYADGTTTAAKVGQGDKESDLALLVPQSIRWTEGLAASELDPIGVPLRAVVPAHGSHLGPAEAGVKGRIETHARDGSPLQPMFDVDVKGPLVAGAPLLDASGSVVAILVRACRGAAAAANPTPDSVPWATWGAAQQTQGKQPPPACAPTVVGAPVSAIRSFLARTPAANGPAAASPNAASPAPTTQAAAAPHTGSTPWLGIRGEPTQDGAIRGVRVVAVAPSSPSQKAGLRPDADTIVAADGHPIDTPESLGEAISRHAPGDTVKLLVYGDDKFREVSVELRPAP